MLASLHAGTINDRATVPDRHAGTELATPASIVPSARWHGACSASNKRAIGSMARCLHGSKKRAVAATARSLQCSKKRATGRFGTELAGRSPPSAGRTGAGTGAHEGSAICPKFYKL